jgi:prepilin-type N-terminal cleavage/methylation domain-containing protein
VRRSIRGFSLIELLAVVFILGVGLASVSMLFVAGTISSSKARRMNTAVDAAQKQMERVRSAGFSGCIIDEDVFSSTDGYTIVTRNADATGQVSFNVPGLPNGQGTVDIAHYDSGAGTYPNLKDVTVTVIWTGGAPTAGRTVLRTLIANRP